MYHINAKDLRCSLQLQIINKSIFFKNTFYKNETRGVVKQQRHVVKHMTPHTSEFKVIRDKNQFWIHFSASGFVQCGNVDICLKMGHIIPDGDGLHQPTNAADTSLYMQRLFIGADSAASKAHSEQTRKEKQPAGKLPTPECLTLCAFVNYFMFSSTTKCSVYVPGKAALT